MPVPKGPTSKVGLEPPHWAGLVVASSCRVVVGMGVGIVAAGSVVVGTHLDLGLCSCFSCFVDSDSPRSSVISQLEC